MAIRSGLRLADPIFQLTSMGTIKLFQYFSRMVKEHQLDASVTQDFHSFIKATDGKYDIMNIPEFSSEELQQLRDMGVHFQELPDLTKDDGLTQLAVYQPDKDKFAAWYERNLLNRMQGGEKELQELKNLTSGRTSIVNFPFEGEEPSIMEDLDKMGVNYAKLPDLNVGDGKFQLVVANSDMSMVEQWYQIKRSSFTEKGDSSLPDKLDQLTMEQYQNTGISSEQQYIEHADPAFQQVNAKYEGQEKGVVEQQVQNQEYRIRSEDNIAYRQYAANADYIPVSIDKKTLVDNSSCMNFAMFRENGQFACRIPGTYNNVQQKKEEYLLLTPIRQVFEKKSGDGYIAFLEKNKTPVTMNVNTGKEMSGIQKLTNEKFIGQYFDKVVDISQGKDQAAELVAEKVEEAVKDAPKKAARAAASKVVPIPPKKLTR